MLNKKILFITLIGSAFLLSSFKISSGEIVRYQKQGIKTIIVDAGHGGEDGGADGHYSKEKDLTLKIAIKLQQTLQLAMPDVNVVMTRTTDVFDNPRVKADKANNANGDLFISIHCDAADPIRHSEVTGHKTQTYYTGKGSKRVKRHVKFLLIMCGTHQILQKVPLHIYGLYIKMMIKNLPCAKTHLFILTAHLVSN
jgi:N-acetylmuramoyl-L-alanine amidase